MVNFAVFKFEQTSETLHLERESFRIRFLQWLEFIDFIVEKRLESVGYIDEFFVLMLCVLQMFISQLTEVLLKPFNLIVFLNGAFLILLLEDRLKRILLSQADLQHPDFGFVLFFLVKEMFFNKLNLVAEFFAHFVLLLCAYPWRDFFSLQEPQSPLFDFSQEVVFLDFEMQFAWLNLGHWDFKLFDLVLVLSNELIFGGDFSFVRLFLFHHQIVLDFKILRFSEPGPDFL